MYRALLDRWQEDLRAILGAFGTSGSMVTGDQRPVPAPEIIRSVNSPEKADASVFLRSGAGDLLAIVQTLAAADVGRLPNDEPPPWGAPTVMEFGCGVGRLLRHAPGPALARMVATDVNAASLGWCRTHLPGVEYHRHDPLPPIVSLPTGSMDVVYAHSVFTHIPLEHQTVWLRELERLIRPGGLLAVTFLGRDQQEALLTGERRTTLRMNGEVQIYPEYTSGYEGPIMYGAVCQTVARQDAIVGAVFDITRRLERPGRQDVVVARRR